MKSLFNTLKSMAGENRSIILAGAALTLLLSFYFISWHVTIITFGSFYSVLDAADTFLARSARYLVFSAIAASVICAVMLALKRPLAKKIFMGIILFLFFGTEFIRMFDWGAMYFSGNHVDANFWTHAFYTDGTTFLLTRVSMLLYLAVILFFAALFYVLKQLHIHTVKGDGAAKLKPALIILGLNCAVALVIGGIVHSSVRMGELARRGDAAARRQAGDVRQSGGGSVSFEVDRKTLLDRDKTMSKVDEMKEKLFKIRNDDPNAYTRLPESEFTGSLFAYFFLSRISGGKEVVLDEELIREFREQGTLLYSMDRNYPLMKRSIYMDRSRKTANKPVVRPGTNIIIVFVESLSDFFLREELHGIKGLTPNIRDMERDSYRFTNMYNSSFPTLKGLIAALGSCIYLLDESVGGTRIPVPCRFLFLSDILKSLEYTTIHIQAGSERFIGMKDIFMKRQSYDYFYGAESLAIDNITSMKRGFGVDDDTVFDYTIGWLEKHPGNRPFLLTISTIDSHPPFKVAYRHPGAGDNDMLNALHSTDRAFGKFWDYFKKSKYANNTLLIVTADHAMGNNKEYIEFMKRHEDHYRPFFDVIPCFLRFPGGAWKGANNTSCLNLDITPTILDMMNIDLANPFMGLSIFSERPYYSRKAGDSGKGLEIKGNYDQKQIAKAKKLIGFYINLYRQDRILPKDFRVKLYR